MKTFFNQHQTEIILTIVIVVSLIVIRFIFKKAAVGIAKRRDINVQRTTLIVRYINTLVTFVVLFAILLIWGIQPNQVALVFSSVFAIIGIGLFAIWSILSNVTAGVILYFYYPFKIGDKIKILDKDFPLEATIEDIKAFQIHLRTDEGDLVTYPNNLILQKSISMKDN
ncbi:mechanosensitive ion channel domain-containing protein [Mesohalobacter halotolerans]|uniref:Mechanosensitive ion channel n=1 Tax=Mesohalobacter halotolerans TaxID=1883405 RepID=A0A4U5TQZ8_9FLAO|nr:mechanosensitive ion channel domain-containing protein [Mesohalobacter halotolerans]TKS56181.1 mechanosensitive ion channel [Mesohalobacter halotolerans]